MDRSSFKYAQYTGVRRGVNRTKRVFKSHPKYGDKIVHVGRVPEMEYNTKKSLNDTSNVVKKKQAMQKQKDTAESGQMMTIGLVLGIGILLWYSSR